MPEDKMSLQYGIMSGLSAIRHLHLEGHGAIEISNPAFPLSGVVEELLKHPREYSSVNVPLPSDKPGSKLSHWTIMGGTDSGNNGSPLYGLARRVALFGQKELSDIPYSKFGDLFTVDRSEIESLRGIQRLIKDYEAKKRPKKPLSIAVFGPPGSGKSFGIKQIAKSIMGDDVPILEFNLSQFTGPKELTDAFHQVRDMVLKGKTPCVFWDEFDSREYLWLQYLLAPMQDGEFREGQLVHPIGKCVFVFAGGTSYDMENFGPSDENSEEYKKFKLLKGPDFVSRLNGYLNVLGPNKRQIYDRASGNWIDDEKPEDICYPVRRALLMRRVMLKSFGKEKLGIDRGLLTAFIEIDRYKHGARSLETILLLSKRDGAKTLRRSDLPPREQMSLHVEYDKFIDLVNRDLPFKLNREAIAPSIHEYYWKRGKKEGWIKPEMDKPYEDLDEYIKEFNLAAAERMPEVLSLVGHEIVTKEHSDNLSHDEYNTLLDDKNNLERMAEAEHDGWLEFMLLNGYERAETTNHEEKKSDSLISYKDLSETNKGKDRNGVMCYYEILENAGYQIIQSK
jgi:hypothetical protein